MRARISVVEVGEILLEGTELSELYKRDPDAAHVMLHYLRELRRVVEPQSASELIERIEEFIYDMYPDLWFPDVLYSDRTFSYASRPWYVLHLYLVSASGQRLEHKLIYVQGQGWSYYGCRRVTERVVQQTSDAYVRRKGARDARNRD